MRYIEMESLRVSWSNDYIGIDKLEELKKFKSVNGAGIIIEENGITFDNFMKTYGTHKFKLPKDDVYIPDRALSEQGKVFDLYVYKLDEKYKYVIMYVDSNTEISKYTGVKRPNDSFNIKQLLNVIEKAYENNIKLILITNKVEDLQFNINYILSKDDYIEQAPRLKDRLKIFFPNLIT
jgi:hypothetical protein